MTHIPIDAIGFHDFLAPETLADPYPLLRRLRDEDPVHADPNGSGWIVTRHEDVAAVLSDRRFSAERLLPSPDIAQPIQAALSRQMLFLDPPDHTRLRGLFTRTFTPGRLELLRPQIAAMVSDLLDQAERAGHVDFLEAFAVPLPVNVIAQMLGVPVEDRSPLRSWSVAFGRLIAGRSLNADESAAAQRGVMEFVDYFRRLIEERRRRPQDDMLSDLITVEEAGQRLTLEELIVNLILLLAAGHGTTTHLFGNGLLALLNHPDQWDRLRSDSSLAASAVQELLRFDAPVQATGRQAAEDLELRGRSIRQGQRVTVMLGSANRDERQFADPDRLDLGRTASRVLSFGHGIHTCLGAALARMEAQIAFPALAQRFPSLRVEAASLHRQPTIAFRGVESLPIALA